MQPTGANRYFLQRNYCKQEQFQHRVVRTRRRHSSTLSQRWDCAKEDFGNTYNIYGNSYLSFVIVTQAFFYFGVKMCIISFKYYYLQLHETYFLRREKTCNMPVNVRGVIFTTVLWGQLLCLPGPGKKSHAFPDACPPVFRGQNLTPRFPQKLAHLCHNCRARQTTELPCWLHASFQREGHGEVAASVIVPARRSTVGPVASETAWGCCSWKECTVRIQVRASRWLPPTWRAEGPAESTGQWAPEELFHSGYLSCPWFLIEREGVAINLCVASKTTKR